MFNFPIPWVDLTPSALLGVAVILLFTGRLIPKSIYQDMRAERDLWRGAAQTSATSVQELTEQLQTVVETEEAVLHIVQGLPKAVEAIGK